jgi:uncharacterized protein YndB with AHSA1/START domain
MRIDTAVTHATLTLARTYPADVGRVFAAWADPAVKGRWFVGPGTDHRLDFRVGGLESVSGRFEDAALTFESLYRDIVAERRIVYTSVLLLDGRTATLSLTAVEFAASAEGTRLLLTEQGTFLDGFEQPAWREQGTATQLDALGSELGAPSDD